MNKAAGILFLSSSGTALFLKRRNDANDCPSCWDFPGGSREADETAEECAIRECREEIGFLPEGLRVFHTRTKGSAPKGVAGIGASPILPVSEGAPAVPTSAAEAAAHPAPTVLLPAVDFTTFLQRVDDEFTPVLNDEHDGFAWAPLNAPPQPIHPGCQIALDRITFNELGVARAIADGRLISPQRYENMFLFAIRITGTDVSFRTKGNEFVVRPPEIYLNDEFLARCNGLPVIFKHPKKSLLNSEEFRDRVVGTVFLPYIAGDEVWAVVKIWVDDVARMMAEGDLSTSPGVNFADWSVNRKMTLHLRDGSKEKVLVEGDPSLWDHIALCELGVWDKGEAPSGVRSESREDSQMTEAELKAKQDAEEAEKKAKDDAARKDAEEKAKADAEEKEKKDAEEKAKADADAGTMLSKVVDSVKAIADSVASMGKRMDDMEMDSKSRRDADEKAKRDAGDPEQLKADKARKDAEEKEKAEKEEKEKKDAEEKAKADSVELRKRIDEVARMVPKDMNDADHMALTDCQARADDVFSDFGLHGPRPLQGETPATYERRCVRMLKEHSPTWKAAALDTAFADEASFAIVREQVYREAKQTANNPVNIPAGRLLERTRNEGGHIIKTFVGQPRDWMDPMAGATQLRGTGVFLHQNLGK
jgi:8-oxo-dGTP pyrophosphatase MutT (NUDIX family)